MRMLTTEQDVSRGKDSYLDLCLSTSGMKSCFSHVYSHEFRKKRCAALKDCTCGCLSVHAVTCAVDNHLRLKWFVCFTAILRAEVLLLHGSYVCGLLKTGTGSLIFACKRV